jgi:hypothetical protein
MVKRTKWFSLVPLAAIAAVCMSAAPAQAATSRAEYIAQVDPICQSVMPSLDQTWAAYNRNYKHWIRQATHGTLKAWVKQTRRTAAALNRLNQVEISLTNQLAAIPPAPGDEAVIGTWLSYRRQSDGLGMAAAVALNHIQVSKFFKLARQADKAAYAGVQVAETVGFQVCDQVS